MKRIATVVSLTLGLGSAGACELVAGIGDRSLAADAAVDGTTPDGAGPEAPGSEGGDDASNEGEAAAPECTTNAQCTAKFTAEGPPEAGAPDGGDAAPFSGTLEGGVVPGVCLKPQGTCARLLSVDCQVIDGNYDNDNAILVGTLFNASGTLAPANIPRLESALMAAHEINSNLAGGGIPPVVDGGARRPLVVVECDPTANAIRAASHLANDLHVPAVVGPNVAEDCVNITQQVSASAGMLLMTPTVPIDAVTYLQDNGLTWRDVPSDHQRAPLYADQLSQIAAALAPSRGSVLRLGVLQRSDDLGTSAVGAIGTAPFNGVTVGTAGSNVDYATYALSDASAQAAIATRYATMSGGPPDIVFVIAQEAVNNIVIPLEQQLTQLDAGAKRPYYLATDTAKTSGWTTSATKPGVPADFLTRVRGVGVTPDSASTNVFTSFSSDFASTYGTNPGTSGMGPAYDGMYSIAYAMAAAHTNELTGLRVAQGLNQLYFGTSIPVGDSSGQALSAFQQLTTTGDIALQGTFTLMHWDSHGDILGGTLEVWCIGTASGTLGFDHSGRTMDVASSVISGSYVQCH
jgi:branched-chain amino acid transport system substrate-binding protein